MVDFVYDTECYPNVWTLGLLNVETKEKHSFEISHRRNDAVAISEFIYGLRGEHKTERYGYSPTKNRMIGYNNTGYDYLVLDVILKNPNAVTCETLYEKSCAIFDDNDRFGHMVWESDHLVTQIDLMKIHHFDNVNKSVRLKDLEFNMEMDSIIDLPFEPGTTLEDYEIEHLIKYQFHDIDATYLFYLQTLKAIEAREILSSKFNKNMLNFNDTKIGKNRFIDMLEEAVPGICYDRSSGRKEPRQTYRSSMAVSDVIFDYVKFEHPEFKRLHNYLLQQHITNTKAGFEDASAVVNGFSYDFGMGGLHGSVSARTIRATENRLIIDVDVESYYPSVKIANRLYPEHLSEMFCDIYAGLKSERLKFPKGTPENAMYKLALNGSFGDTNNPYSPLYDPLVTMRTTLNGQLLLAMLAEKLISIHGLEMIQANTDGLTFAVDKKFESLAMAMCAEWEKFTCLKLERADYSMMCIRDVNNYIAQYTDGKLKHKGCYVYDCEWHKDHSHKIVAKAAEAALIRGEDYVAYITSSDRKMSDFMGKAKVPRTSILYSNRDRKDTKQQGVSRYYISKRGVTLIKSMPPLPKQLAVNPDAPRRRIGISPATDWFCCIANKLPEESYFRKNVNMNFYIERAEKIITPLLNS